MRRVLSELHQVWSEGVPVIRRAPADRGAGPRHGGADGDAAVRGEGHDRAGGEGQEEGARNEEFPPILPCKEKF